MQGPGAPAIFAKNSTVCGLHGRSCDVSRSHALIAVFGQLQIQPPMTRRSRCILDEDQSQFNSSYKKIALV